MVRVIMGVKGTGKTKQMIELINSAVHSENGNVVCIERGPKLTYDIHYKIRLVEANDRDLVDFLRAGVAELGISANGDTAPDMESEVLRMENIILAVPAGFPVNRGLEAYVLDPVCGNEVPGVPLERFAEERFLFMKPGNDMR